MFLLAAQEMRNLEELSIKRDGVSSFSLMAQAGFEAFNLIKKKHSPLFKKKILILCGPGNNGGDGLVVAKHLIKAGALVKIIFLTQKLKGDSKIAYENLKKDKSLCFFCSSIREIQKIADVEKLSLIVDALFGTGLKRPVSGIYLKTIHWVNSLQAHRLSIDIPSGICTDSGKVLGVAFQAHETVTMGFPKLGLFTGVGPDYAGEILVAPLSFSLPSIRDIHPKNFLITRVDIQSLLKPRPRQAHKGSFGHVFIIGCSRQKLGAGIITAQAALRVGAGLSTLVLPDGAYQHIPSEGLEVMYEPIGEKNYFVASDVSCVLEKLSKAKVVALGPGLGTNPETIRFVHHMVKQCRRPLVLDADALNAISRKPGLLRERKQITLLTPHPAEMARLIGKSTSHVQTNRLNVARDFSMKYGVVLVLKGYRSLVSFPDGSVWVNPTGNSAMASAGQGDTLTGLYAGLLSQFLEDVKTGNKAPFLFGCFLHGLVGDLLSQSGAKVVLASDIIKNLNLAYRFLANKGPLLESDFY
jgi:hydroxyethylthiazole kinase-like uncharacterized protein yjeF